MLIMSRRSSGLKRWIWIEQQTLAVAADQGAGYGQCRRPTKDDDFLVTMERDRAVAVVVCRDRAVRSASGVGESGSR